ncbi:unnamed protein product [Rotaria magnacalcarata]|uniref:Uncharacterized protein n=1 Tax=Rotaria magnacalcarata TaxID=392030 RepID=A0A8S2R726_9BILA|nr:unnamed protein product [Rotaria magnacalcarata]
MNIDSFKINTNPIDRNEFCGFIADLIQSSLPLSLFHIGLDIDNLLSTLLPTRDDHIVSVVEQAFNVSIKPNKLRHYLNIFKQAACNDMLTIWQTKAINVELNEYTKKKIIHSVDVSYQYCSPIQIEPPNSVSKVISYDDIETYSSDDEYDYKYKIDPSANVEEEDTSDDEDNLSSVSASGKTYFHGMRVYDNIRPQSKSYFCVEIGGKKKVHS